MGMHKIAKMPSPEELKEEMPLSEEAKQIKAARDKEIRDVFTGASDKFLVIIGPCSADNETAVMDYLGRLARVQKDLADKLLIIPRIYTNKPRTTGDGYKGMVHQPDPEKAPDMASGLRSVRKLHMLLLLPETHCLLPRKDPRCTLSESNQSPQILVSSLRSHS